MCILCNSFSDVVPNTTVMCFYKVCPQTDRKLLIALMSHRRSPISDVVRHLGIIPNPKSARFRLLLCFFYCVLFFLSLIIVLGLGAISSPAHLRSFAHSLKPPWVQACTSSFNPLIIVPQKCPVQHRGGRQDRRLLPCGLAALARRLAS